MLAAAIGAGSLGAIAEPAHAAGLEDCTTTTCTVTFDFTGAAEYWIVPDWVTEATFDLYGAEGGRGGLYGANNPGGKGAHIRSTLDVVGGETLTVVVGGQGLHNEWQNGGFNGGGGTWTVGGVASIAAGGGGATDVRRAEARLLVAGGGGGGAGCGDTSDCAIAGGRGGDSGSAGERGAGTDEAGGWGGGPGSAETGGEAGAHGYDAHVYRPSTPGGPAVGGAGAYGLWGGDGGGGGGGYFGGGGGGTGGPIYDWEQGWIEDGGGGGGGGGGSSLVTGQDTLVEDGVRTGNGLLTITYALPDTIAPVVQTPADLTATTTDPSGAAVSYEVPSATDEVDGSVAVACAPASGTTFPVGATTVTCSATDRAGNTGSSSFTVTVTKIDNKADVRAAITGPASATAGSTVTYTVVVTNSGPAAATDLSAVLATTGLTGTSGTPGGRSGSVMIGGVTVTGTTWRVASLAAGESVSFSITGTVNAKRGKIVTAIGGGVSRTSDPNPLNNLSVATTRVG